MNKHLPSICAILLVTCASTPQVQANVGLTGFSIDSAAIQTLEKAETLYSAGNYDRAYFIYRHALAPTGDKYAQYMVGYMHLMGQGAEQDRVLATAWYRLAAERGTREFIMVYNQLLVSLTSDQVSEYERAFLDLREQFGDLTLLMRAIRKDYDLLKYRTGSRLGSDTSAVTVIEVRNRVARTSSEDYFQKVEDRLMSRIALIGKYIDIDIADVDMDTLDLKEIERLVDRKLSSLE